MEERGLDSEGNAWQTDAIDDAMIEDHSREAILELDRLTLKSDQFVNWFAQINTCRYFFDPARGSCNQGNSRLALTPFTYHCGIRDCTY